MQTAIQSAASVPVTPTMIGGESPLIDVADYLAGKPGAAERAAAELRFAFEHVGFYYLAGHGVPPALIDTAYAEAARFHALPLETKLAVKVDEHNIGYMPIARKPPPNAAAQGKKPSQNEAYFLRREKTPDHPDVLSNRRFHAMNKWPAEADIPGFRANMLAYMGTMEALCRKLGMRRQNYYARRTLRNRRWVDGELVMQLVRQERQWQPRLGARKLRVLLRDPLAKAGVRMGRDRFFEVLREYDLLLLPRRSENPRTTNSYHNLPIFTNLINKQ